MADEGTLPKEAVSSSEQKKPVSEGRRDQDLNDLRDRLRRRENEKQRTRNFSRDCLIGSAASFLLALISELLAGGVVGVWLVGKSLVVGHLAAIALVYVSAICEVMALANRAKTRDLEANIEQLEFQIDLFSYELSEQELKAEKLLRLNDFQLRRYYDLNLYQNGRVFNLGIGCIVGGVVIIVATMHELHLQQPTKDMTLQIATAALGAVGALLTNYVAAIYLKMNAAASENLASFHARLVETHQLMLGNLLASRIEDDQLRWNTLSQLAQKLVPNK